MRVHRYYFQGRTKNTRATCMLKPPNVARQNCLFLNKGDVFSWLWTVYSNTYVSRSYLKTTCQRQNHLRKRSSKHQSPCQPLVTYAASIQLTLEVFPGKRVVLEPSLHFNPGLQSSVCILPSVYILPLVCSLRFTLTAPLWFSRLDHQLTDSCLCFAHLMAASNLHPIPLILITIFKPLSTE